MRYLNSSGTSIIRYIDWFSVKGPVPMSFAPIDRPRRHTTMPVQRVQASAFLLQVSSHAAGLSVPADLSAPPSVTRRLLQTESIRRPEALVYDRFGEWLLCVGYDGRWVLPAVIQYSSPLMPLLRAIRPVPPSSLTLLRALSAMPTLGAGM